MKNVKNKKLVFTIIAICLIIIVVAIVAIVAININTPTSKPKQITKIETQDQALNYVKQMNKLIIEGGTKEELKHYGIDVNNIPSNNIMTGEDAYLRLKPTDEIIKNYKLSSYVKKADGLAKNLEQEIKNNFEFKSGGVVEAKDYFSVLAYYKSFYYMEYMFDFNNLVEQLINKENIIIDVPEKISDKEIADIYKIQVKAMEILDKNLDTYINHDEFHQAYVQFTNGKISMSTNSLNSYLLSISGFSNNIIRANSAERIQQYLKAIK